MTTILYLAQIDTAIREELLEWRRADAMPPA